MAFRKWKKPTVKKGGTLITRIGQLKILDVVPIDLKEISDKDLKASGYDDIGTLERNIYRRFEGQLYKISFTLIGPDPRIALRNNDQLTQSDIMQIKLKLGRMDNTSIHGPWTKKVLHLILNNPKRRAIELAESMGVEKDWLKKNIRKLKSLGLTISHGTGYEVSPRGKAYFEKVN